MTQNIMRQELVAEEAACLMTAKKQRVEKGQEIRHISSWNASRDLIPLTRPYL
jgi:hypothetical protein